MHTLECVYNYVQIHDLCVPACLYNILRVPVCLYVYEYIICLVCVYVYKHVCVHVDVYVMRLVMHLCLGVNKPCLHVANDHSRMYINVLTCCTFCTCCM